MIVDPILAFIKAYRLKGDNQSLKKVISDRFDFSALEEAKRKLWVECEQALNEVGLVSQRRRSAIKYLEDILAAFEALDTTASLPEMFCEAKDMLKLPSLSLDPVSELVNQNSDSLSEVLTNLSSLKEQLGSSVQSLTTKISTLQSRVAELSTASLNVPPNSPATASPTSPPLQDTANSRSMSQNKSSSFDLQRQSDLILFGLPEQGSLIETKSAVDEVLEFLAGRQVPIKDLIRLGKLKAPTGGPQTPQRPRPVLIKFSTAWDRRLVLASKRKLKEFRTERLFIREDLSPQVRLERQKPPASTTSTNSAMPSSSSFTPSDDHPSLSGTHSVIPCHGSNTVN